MNRIFGAVEAEWCVRVSAEHLAGSTNFLADLGSRAWSPDTVGDWNELTTSWMQVVVPANARKAYDGSWSNFSSGPWPIHLDASMHRPGKVGSALTAGSDALHGYQSTTKSRSLSNWCCLPSIGGRPPTTDQVLSVPYTPSLAISDGIIVSMPGSTQSLMPATQQHSSGCADLAHPQDQEHQSQFACSSGSRLRSIPKTHNNASFLGLRSPNIWRFRVGDTDMLYKYKMWKYWTLPISQLIESGHQIAREQNGPVGCRHRTQPRSVRSQKSVSSRRSGNTPGIGSAKQLAANRYDMLIQQVSNAESGRSIKSPKSGSNWSWHGFKSDFLSFVTKWRCICSFSGWSGRYYNQIARSMEIKCVPTLHSLFE
ncbi:hypothetical protein PHMEG_00039007 [Phytophthora megakarya]|uniref:Uncharacterized protein n=1 Tax=Phytophthora megakarya TaxID=4795 RepID=A0A225UJ18_9STRA|nr:hypothetical protein PHMEG_00039007 [Phytophthora megakarya]